MPLEKGSTRHVLISDKLPFVLKIPNSREHVEANRIEALCADLHPDIVAATRLSIFGLINFQQRAEPVEIQESIGDMIKAALPKYIQDLMKDVKMPTNRNFGWIGDRIYLVDAGEKAVFSKLELFSDFIVKALLQVSQQLRDQTTESSPVLA